MKTSKIMAIMLIFCLIVSSNVVNAAEANIAPEVTAEANVAPRTAAEANVTPTEPESDVLPETINFHERALVVHDIPKWLLKDIVAHDKLCGQWAEAELTRIIQAHLADNTTDSFTIKEVVEDEVCRFVTYDNSTGLLRVGDTQSSVGKPTVGIDKVDKNNIEKLVETYGFDLVLSIVDQIKSEKSPEEIAKEKGLDPIVLANIYETEGWQYLNKRDIVLPTSVANDSQWGTAFWTENYEHYIAVGAGNEDEFSLGGHYNLGEQGLFVDGKFLSLIPEKYPVSYDEMLAEWSQNDTARYDFCHWFSRREICCTNDGIFFTLEDDCQVYTWQFTETQPAYYQIYWEPTYQYPILHNDNVVKTDGDCYSTWYLVTSGNEIDVVENYCGHDSGHFGIWEQFGIKFRHVTSVQPFALQISSNDETSGGTIAYVAIPETNTIWRIAKKRDYGTCGIAYIHLDQVEIANDAIYVREKGKLTKIAYHTEGTWEGVDESLEDRDFIEVMWSGIFQWNFDPDKTEVVIEGENLKLVTNEIIVTTK